MESRKLQITIHSGKGLPDVKFFGTMDPYAVVWVAVDGKKSNSRKTKTAIKGGLCPVWDCRMEFNLASMYSTSYTLFCDIKHDGKLFDREIGYVKVPFRDLAGDASGEKVSYPVKNSSGEVEGEIILSHKFTVGSGEKAGTSHKVSGGPGKKAPPIKKNVTMKRVAKKMVKKVATEAVSVAVAAGIMLAVDGDDGDEEGDVDGDEYDDEEGDVDEDEDEEGDVDEDEDEYEDEDDMEY